MYKAKTNEVKQVELPSAIEHTLWTRRVAAPGGTVGLEVFTHFVGNGAPLKVRLYDGDNRALGETTVRIMGGRFQIGITIPSKARRALVAEVELPDYSLKAKTLPLLLTRPIEIRNAKWSAKEARRGDVLTLAADVESDGATDGMPAEIVILEHDDDGAHDVITRLKAVVQRGRVEVDWEYEYHEDTDAIPTDEEAERGYNPPEYFFRVSVHGLTAESDLLTFKDWFEIVLEASPGVPFADQEYEATFADGSTRTGPLDATGRVRLDDVPPGPIEVRFPGLEGEEG